MVKMGSMFSSGELGRVTATRQDYENSKILHNIPMITYIPIEIEAADHKLD